MAREVVVLNTLIATLCYTEYKGKKMKTYREQVYSKYIRRPCCLRLILTPLSYIFFNGSFVFVV